MNTGTLFKTEATLLTRDQVADLARRANLTIDDLKPRAATVLRDMKLERHIERLDGKVVRLLKINDAKYGVMIEPTTVHGETFGRLANLNTGMPIPENEPLMIFRGQDRHALAAIEAYCRVVTTEGTSIAPLTADSAQERFMEFQRFANEHPERMKDPS